MTRQTALARPLSLIALGILLTLGLFTLSPTPTVQATTTWQITRLTDNSVADVAQDLTEGHAFWTHYDGHDMELFMRDPLDGSHKQLTDNDAHDNRAQFAGGRLAWESIPLSEITTGRSSIMLMAPHGGTPIALTPADRTRVLTDVKPGKVCWQENPGGTAPIQAFFYEVGTGATTRITDASVHGENPSSDGRWVAYTRWWRSPGTTPYSRVMLYDVGSNTTRDLNPNLNWREESYNLYGSGILLYMSHDGHDWEVWAADLLADTRAQISNDDVDSWAGGLSRDTLVAWTDAKPGATDDDPTKYRVHLFDLAAGAEVWVGDYMFSMMSLDFEGDLLVWAAAETPDADREVYVFDCATGVLTQLTDNDHEDLGSTTDGHRILWTAEVGDVPGGTRYDRQEVLIAEPYTPPATTTFFLDVPETHPYRAAIEGLRVAGAIGGYETAAGWEFRPTAPAYRAQFAKMICETLGLEVPTDLACPFTDLGPDDPTNLYPHQYVAMAAAKGITTGTGPNRFSPFSNISRAQVVTMTVRAADSLAPGALQAPPAGFQGALGSFSTVHAESMRKAEHNSLLEGLAAFDKTWDPWAPATRGEMAAVLWALREALE